MRARGWTEQQIQEAIDTGEFFPQQTGSIRYKHPKTGNSVVIDPQTGQVFHVGSKRADGNEFDYSDWDK